MANQLSLLPSYPQPLKTELPTCNESKVGFRRPVRILITGTFFTTVTFFTIVAVAVGTTLLALLLHSLWLILLVFAPAAFGLLVFAFAGGLFIVALFACEQAQRWQP